jgi:hypothetical protein
MRLRPQAHDRRIQQTVDNGTRHGFDAGPLAFAQVRQPAQALLQLILPDSLRFWCRSAITGSTSKDLRNPGSERILPPGSLDQRHIPSVQPGTVPIPG